MPVPRTKLKTAPTVEPVTAAECKLVCRYDGEEFDSLFDEWITAARQYAEQQTGRALITQTWYAYLDAFPTVIRLPYPTLQSVVSITYLDTGGDTQTLAADQYTVNTYEEPGTIVEAYGCSWPSTYGVENSVTVEYVCGYGDAATNVPDGIKQAVRNYVLYLFKGDDVDPAVLAAVTTTLAQFTTGWQW